jgi:hypothetical protein
VIQINGLTMVLWDVFFLELTDVPLDASWRDESNEQVDGAYLQIQLFQISERGNFRSSVISVAC